MTLSSSDLDDWRQRVDRFEAEVGKAVIGQERVLRLITISIFARGHVLLEGDVGVGKTTMLQAVARAIGGAYGRVEGTIDLMPGDLVYHTYIDQDGRPRVEPGPVLRHGGDLAVFFFNEINRARPQVHSLLLRLMAERSMTAFNREYSFPSLQVFADRNQVEREETFELPAAARDRFFMEIVVERPQDPAARQDLVFDPRFHDVAELVRTVAPDVLDHTRLDEVSRAIQNSVHASEAIQQYVLELWEAIRDPYRAGVVLEEIDVARLVIGGASPRGMSYLVRAARVRAWLAQRQMLVPEDLRAVFPEVIAHRVFLSPVYEARRNQVMPALCRAVLERVAAP
jgi:MoxR-like ATPase